MNKIFRYIRGYLKVRLTGHSPERMLNMCGNKSAVIWNLQKKGEGYEFSMPISLFRQLKPIVKKTGTRVEILEKKGLPFIIHSYKARQMFLAGILMFAFILFTLSQYIWEISIEGSQMYTEQYLIKYLASQNITAAMKKKHANADKIEENLILTQKYISWASVEIRGSRMIVHVKEALPAPINEQKKAPCDIVAREDAIITSIVTRRGTPMVKKGDRVKRGQVLISGTVNLYNDSAEVYRRRYVAASGDITAKVKRNYRYRQPLVHQKKEYTGRESTVYEYFLGSSRIKAYLGKTEYDKYDKMVEVEQYKINPSLSIPIRKHKMTYKEYIIYESLYSDEEVIRIAKEKLNRTIKRLREEGMKTLSNRVKFRIEKGVCFGKGTLLLHRDICREKKINVKQKRVEFSNERKGANDTNTEQ